MYAGVELRYLPMPQTLGEKGTDVALAVDGPSGWSGGYLDAIY